MSKLRTVEIFLNRYKTDTRKTDRLKQVETRVYLEKLLQEKLIDSETVFQFEADITTIDEVLVAIESANLKTKYIFSQVSESLFQAMLKHIEI